MIVTTQKRIPWVKTITTWDVIDDKKQKQTDYKIANNTWIKRNKG